MRSPNATAGLAVAGIIVGGAVAVTPGVLFSNHGDDQSMQRTRQILAELDDPSVLGHEKDSATQGTNDMKGAPNAPKAAKSAISRAGFDITRFDEARVEKLADEKKLTADERRIILNRGVYLCRLCDLPLFDSNAKFNSGTGWPSFFKPYDMDHVDYKADVSHGMKRVEILCVRCGAHLGHVFDDGTDTPTGLRFCLNSASLDFVERGADGNVPWKPLAMPITMQTAYFAGGCFWGVEDRFQQTPGVINAVSGYMGGKVDKPTYKQVCYTDTGHAETVMITFDPAKITYNELLEKFFKYHNPTQLNRQGPDVGEQYRSAIFVTSDEQMTQAKEFIATQRKTPRFKDRPIVTQVVDARTLSETGKFHTAEEYHQDYHERNGGHCALPEE
jgi:peptide methionine sulfoxide reductase msrA/msrB